jgi:hypothetical protein
MATAAGSRCSNLRLTSATRAPASASARATPRHAPLQDAFFENVVTHWFL